MRPGDTVNLTIKRRTVGGSPSTGKASADFTIQAYLDGASVAVSPTWTEIGSSGTWDSYKLAITLPNTAGYFHLFVNPASGLDIVEPSFYDGEIEANDIDSTANLILTSAGQPATNSAADSDLGDIVDHDSYLSATITIPTSKLTVFNQSDLTGLTLEAAIMGTPGGTSYPITCTVLSASSRTLTFGWNSQQHPALSVGVASAKWYIDVQAIKAGSPNLIQTVARYSFNQVWERDTRVS